MVLRNQSKFHPPKSSLHYQEFTIREDCVDILVGKAHEHVCATYSTILGTPRRFTPLRKGLVSVVLVLPCLYRIYDTATGVTRLAFH